MSDYKPTFRVSPKKRPWYKRLTPLAWTMIGVAVLVVILAGVAAAMAFGNRRASEEPWWTPTPTPPPSPTPIPPTPTPTLPASVWWADQMTEENGHLYPPPEVEDEVWEAFIAGLGCVYISDRESPPEEPREDIVQYATQFLSDRDDVWYIACNGATTLAEAIDVMRPMVLVEFGPRNPVVCDESPVQCKTAVSFREVGVVVYLEEACQKHADAGAPCILRPPKFTLRPGRFLFIGDLQYDGETEQWEIVHLEEKEL